MDSKKVYYYIICLVSLFILFWGLVDLSSASLGLLTSRYPTPTLEQGAPAVDRGGDASLDVYYQKRVLYDRLTDSFARIIIAGLVFAYCRLKVNKLES